MEFYDRAFIRTGPAVKKNCSIRYSEEENAVYITTERGTERISQPDLKKLGLSPCGKDGEHPVISEEDYFVLDQTAMREAARIYRVLAQDAGIGPEHFEGQEAAT